MTNSTTLVLGGEPSARKITVEQGNETYHVVPLTNGQQIEEFYDYGNAKINSPLPIAKSEASRLFFWSGPNGISLVVLHDKANDGTGAAVTMQFGGLPTSTGSWIVRDDGGDYTSETRFDWSWADTKPDGGVSRGGLTDQTVTIHPAFNDEASRNPLTPGSLNRWELLTGQATAPENFSLDMDEPVTIHIPEAPTENGSGDLAGDTGSANWSVDLGGTDSLAIFYQTEQTDVNPAANITITGADGNTVTYTVKYRVTDPSGAKSVHFYKKGNYQMGLALGGVQNSGIRQTSFTFNGYETLLADGVLGPRVHVETVDDHGNRGKVVRQGQNSFARLAGFIGKYEPRGFEQLYDMMPKPIVAGLKAGGLYAKGIPVLLLAAMSGIVYGGGLVIDDLIRLLKNPEKLVDLVKMIGTLFAHPELILKIPVMLGRTIIEAQRTQNPFPRSKLTDLKNLEMDALHVVFAAGWYAGGLVGMIGAELALGLGIASSVKKMATISSKFAKLYNSYRGLKLLLKAKALGVARWAANGITTGLKYLDAKAIAPALARIAVGRQAVVLRLVDDVPGPKRKAVADRGQEEVLVAYLRRTGDGGKKLLGKLDETLPTAVSKRLLSIGENAREWFRLFTFNL